MTNPILLPQPELDYPDSDGKPMAETDFQRIPLTYAVEVLDLYFADRPDVYVSGNILVYYEPGQPTQCVAPDVMVTLGIPKGRRRVYKVWEEGKAPDFVLEITSKSTRTEDQGPKRGLYAYLGVREYCLYDPTGDYLDPVLQGWRLNGPNYDPLPLQALNGTLALYSETLGLELRAEGRGELRFYDPKMGQRLLSRQEAEVARLDAERRAVEAEERATRAEAEAARLLAELKRLRGES